MSKAWRRTFVQRLRDQSGQMTIFIALIFQVLFIFFAMVINIGLLVHDKINLQNSVDFAAYYAAQKQAETLNEIAHINYQLRQDYKLLAWRYHVLGTLGRQGQGSPAPPNVPGTCLPPGRTVGIPLNEQQYVPCAPGTAVRQPEFPSVCVAHEMWQEFVERSDQQENYCFRAYAQSVPVIPQVEIIAPFIPGIAAAAQSAVDAEFKRAMSLRGAGPLNWMFLMQMIYAYKMSIAGRKEMIKQLRANLVSSAPVDQQMQPVREGVLKTLRKNLTASNNESFDEDYFQVLNGLADGSCASGGSGAGTIAEIPTAPRLYFTNSDIVDPGKAFQQSQEIFTNVPNLDVLDPNGLMRSLAAEPGDTNNSLHSTLGFEKNPWCMAYVAVRAKTKPRKPFLPFGQPVELEARAFAQPFGGRIGPWYQKGWRKGSPRSDTGDRVDPLTSIRKTPGAYNPSFTDALPNFSRYPGDGLGLYSQATMGAQRHLLSQYNPMTSATPAGPFKLSLSFYSGFGLVPAVGDPLAWDYAQNADPTQVSPRVQPVRTAEIAAISPDVFDTTYYSIDPSYQLSYLALGSTANRFPGLPQIFGVQIRPMPDIGARANTSVAAYDVFAQVNLVNGGGGNDPGLMNGVLNYPIRQWEHLLTAWAPARAQTFTFPDQRFGQCSKGAPLSLMIPGRCAAGGRVGYSVRIISRDHLISTKWKIGGEAPEDTILNPPSPAF